MTQNQLTYWANQETARANLARETETNRHNLEDEKERHRANVANETETATANRNREYETNRSNVRNEQIKQDKQDLDAWNALWGKNGVYGDGNWKRMLMTGGLKQHDYKGNPILNDTYFGNIQESPSYTVPQDVGKFVQGVSDTLWGFVGKGVDAGKKWINDKLPWFKTTTQKS